MAFYINHIADALNMIKIKAESFDPLLVGIRISTPICYSMPKHSSDISDKSTIGQIYSFVFAYKQADKRKKMHSSRMWEWIDVIDKYYTQMYIHLSGIVDRIDRFLL